MFSNNTELNKREEEIKGNKEIIEEKESYKSSESRLPVARKSRSGVCSQ
jgi:hypothetical protein